MSDLMISDEIIDVFGDHISTANNRSGQSRNRGRFAAIAARDGLRLSPSRCGVGRTHLQRPIAPAGALRWRTLASGVKCSGRRLSYVAPVAEWPEPRKRPAPSQAIPQDLSFQGPQSLDFGQILAKGLFFTAPIDIVDLPTVIRIYEIILKVFLRCCN